MFSRMLGTDGVTESIRGGTGHGGSSLELSRAALEPERTQRVANEPKGDIQQEEELKIEVTKRGWSGIGQ